MEFATYIMSRQPAFYDKLVVSDEKIFRYDNVNPLASLVVYFLAILAFLVFLAILVFLSYVAFSTISTFLAFLAILAFSVKVF